MFKNSLLPKKKTNFREQYKWLQNVVIYTNLGENRMLQAVQEFTWMMTEKNMNKIIFYFFIKQCYCFKKYWWDANSIEKLTV